MGRIITSVPWSEFCLHVVNQAVGTVCRLEIYCMNSLVVVEITILVVGILWKKEFQPEEFLIL